MSRQPPSIARPRLDRESILRAALEIADVQGTEALKMRELAHALGYEAMALYRHVANKEAVLEGILDLALSELQFAPPTLDWASAIEQDAKSLHNTLTRHPWAAALLTTPVGLRPLRLDFAESLLAQLERAGLPASIRFHAYHVLDAYIVGFSLWQQGHTLSEAERALVKERLSDNGGLDDYPRLAEHRDAHRVTGPHQNVNSFETGLELILSGLTKQVP
jgi:AcrR family transcriptional regulator